MTERQNGRCKPKPLPPAEVLRSLLEYNPDSGELRWLAAGSGRRVGMSAGTTDCHGYRRVTVLKAPYLAHRIIWKMHHDTEPDEIDHINGDRSDNRISNLRPATRAQNARNVKPKPGTASGVTGVNYVKGKNRWKALVMVRGKVISLGQFKRIEDAIAARRAGEMEHFGEYRRAA